MAENKNRKEIANPVFNTAKYTLDMLSNSGVTEAEKYLEALGFDKEATASYGLADGSKNALAFSTMIIQEARYYFINRVIEEKGYKNIFDLACGFSPRGYKYSKLGYKYVGADLPATVELVEPVAQSVMDETCKIPVEYRALDLTNPASVVEGAKVFDGEVCITTEGLLVYLDAFETGQFVEGIKRVLREHGGCFVTPDYYSRRFFMAVTFAILGPEEGMKALIASHKKLEETSDTKIRTTSLATKPGESGEDAAKRFFESKGLKVELVPFYEYDTNLGSLEGLDPQLAENIKKGLHEVSAWIVTLDEKYKEEENDVTEIDSKESTLMMHGDQLYISLVGRLDSINAPILIEQYEELTKDVEYNSITVDMNNLDYISSAGLRFLLILKKRALDKPMVIEGVKEDVYQIFEMTGFTDIFDLK